MVTSWTFKPSWPADFSSDFAWAMSCSTSGRSSGKSGSVMPNTSLPMVPLPPKTCSSICWRSTTSFSAWRTLTSLKGAWSTRMVKGPKPPVLEMIVAKPADSRGAMEVADRKLMTSNWPDCRPLICAVSSLTLVVTMASR